MFSFLIYGNGDGNFVILFRFPEMYFDRGNFYDFTSLGEYTFSFHLFFVIMS